MLKLALIFCGGGAGALARYLIHDGVGRVVGAPFPFGTLLVNVLGCFAIGYFATVFSDALPLREEYRYAVLVGVLGGFTTFSTFAAETLMLFQAGHWALASLNVVTSSGFALGAAWIGHRLAVG